MDWVYILGYTCFLYGIKKLSNLFCIYIRDNRMDSKMIPIVEQK